MMKFPKPRILEENTYPDLTLTQPQLFHDLIHKTIYPEQNSPIDTYYDTTIKYLKDAQRLKLAAVKINSCLTRQALYFAEITINNYPQKIQCLLDSGATNSLLHTSVIENMNLDLKPIQLALSTANGTSSDAIKSYAHVNINFTHNQSTHTDCTLMLISSQLNGLQAILGADFLMDPNKVHSFNSVKLTFPTKPIPLSVPVIKKLMSPLNHHISIIQPDEIAAPMPHPKTEKISNTTAEQSRHLNQTQPHIYMLTII